MSDFYSRSRQLENNPKYICDITKRLLPKKTLMDEAYGFLLIIFVFFLA